MAVFMNELSFNFGLSSDKLTSIFFFSLKILSDKALHGLEGIYRDGHAVGYLRRADFGHTVDKTVCYGYIKHHKDDVVTTKYLKSGTYTIDAMGDLYPATLHLKPVFDPKNNRVKGIYD